MNNRLRMNIIFSEGDQKLANTLAYFYFALFAINAYHILEPIIGIPYGIVSIILKGTSALLILSCTLIFVKRLSVFHVVLVLTIVIASIVNILLFQDNNEYFADILMDFITLPFLVSFFAITFEDISKFYESLLKFSIVGSCGVLFIDLFLLAKISSFEYEKPYFMGMSGALVLPTMMIILDFNRQTELTEKIIRLLLIIANMSFILIKGSRGALFTIVLGFVVIILKYKRNVRVSIVIMMLASFFFTFFESILIAIRRILTSLHITSRTVDQLILNATYLSNREILQERIIHELLRNPFSIRGIGADYVLNGVYAHNFFLELLYDFGMFVGGLLCLFIIALEIYVLVMPCEDDSHWIRFLFFVSSVPLSLISGSVFNSVNFLPWILMIFKQKRYYETTTIESYLDRRHLS